MQYYSQSSYPGCTGYPSQASATNTGYQTNSSYPWQNQQTSTFDQYTLLQYGCDYRQDDYQQQYSSIPISLPTSYTGLSHTLLSQNMGLASHVTTGNQIAGQNYSTTILPQYGNQTTSSSSIQNDHVIRSQKSTTGRRSVASSNPLSLNFSELRQAIGEGSSDGSAASSDREKYRDSSKKPPYSYVAMIHMALTNSLNKKCTLREILDYIEDRFPYYKQHSRKLHGAIRHNLTLNDCFVKAGRRLGDKGCLWTLDKGYEGMFENGSLLRRKCRLLQGRVDKYNRNKGSKKKPSKIGAKSQPLCEKQEVVSESRGQNTPPSGIGECKVSSPCEGSSCESTPTSTDSSPSTHCPSPFDLGQFTDICLFPEMNNADTGSDVTNVCRRLSTELSDDLSPSSSPARHCRGETEVLPVTTYSACAFSSKGHTVSNSSVGNVSPREAMAANLTGLDVEFPAFLDIPDIMAEVDMTQVNYGFNQGFLSWT